MEDGYLKTSYSKGDVNIDNGINEYQLFVWLM